MISVAEMWTGYFRQVVPPDAGSVQIEESRRAFYAGAAFMYDAATRGIGDPSVSEDEADDYLEKIGLEFCDYADSISDEIEAAK